MDCARFALHHRKIFSSSSFASNEEILASKLLISRRTRSCALSCWVNSMRSGVCRRLIPESALKTRARAEAWSEKCHFCKPLPTQFRRDGFEYRQIAREGNAAIYEQTWIGCPAPSVCYQVIRIRRRDGFRIGKRLIEPAEVYPKSEAWALTASRLRTKARHSQSCGRFLSDHSPVNNRCAMARCKFRVD